MNTPAEKCRLGNLVTFVSGGTPSKQNAAYWGGDTPWVSAKDLKSFRIGSSIDTLSGEGRKLASLLPVGAVLILVRGMSLFKGIPLGVATRELAINQDLKGLIPNKNISSIYIAYSLQAQANTLLQMVEAAGHGTGRLDTEAVKNLRVRIPSLQEQNEIVDALTCWDAAIEKTVQLIAAKELSQKGLMQRLLCNDGAPLHRLSDFIGRVTRKNTAGNNHPLTISGKDGLVSQSQYFDKRIAAETTEHYTLLKRGEFAYNKSYSVGYPYGAIKRLDAHDEGIVSSLYLCFALKKDAPLLSDYLAYYCEAGGFNHQIHRYAQEGARNHGLLNVAMPDFFGMTMPLPSAQQQARVVEILNGSAQELTLLRVTLQRLRDQKRGLMQKLLTGQWRVEFPEAEAV